jgi:hypothetical protein
MVKNIKIKLGYVQSILYICGMKKKQYQLTENDKSIIKQLELLSPEALDAVRSVLHSSAIKKGHTQPALVQGIIGELNGLLKNYLEEFIPFTDVVVPENYSQAGGYKVDNYVETEKVIYLIDPKGESHNNNTPISDECKKWVLAKEQVQKNNPTKEVRFILLKPNTVDIHDFNRLKRQYNNYGIECHITDNFLSELIGRKVNVSNVLKDNKVRIMRESVLGLCD